MSETEQTVDFTGSNPQLYESEERRQESRDSEYPLQVLTTHIESSSVIEEQLATVFSELPPYAAARIIARHDVDTPLDDPQFNAVTQLIKLAGHHYDQKLDYKNPDALEFSLIYAQAREEAATQKKKAEADAQRRREAALNAGGVAASHFPLKLAV